MLITNILNHFLFYLQDGKKKLYETGQWLRQRYGNYLGKEYTPDVSLLQHRFFIEENCNNCFISINK